MAFAIGWNVVKALSKESISKGKQIIKQSVGFWKSKWSLMLALFTTNHLPEWQDQWKKEITSPPT